MRDAMLVALGGAVGATARWGIGVWAFRHWEMDFPWHTLAINLLGAFLLGLLMALSVDRGIVSPAWRALLGVGVLGGFTTFSTLSYETLTLIQNGFLLRGVANMLGSGIGGVLAALLGVLLAHAL